MRLKVKVKPNASRNEIISEKENLLRVNIKAPAKDGKANLKLIKFLKKHFKREPKIVSGHTSKKR